jgi:hypothetical protein
MNEMLQRVWDNLIGRTSGPMNFRLIIQPAVAIFIAIRAGLNDAREGRPVPKEGYFGLEQGNYGPVFSRTPACYGFTIIAKLKPGREAAMLLLREHG